MTQIQLKDDELRHRLHEATNTLQNPELLTSSLERLLISQTLQNFHSNGRPKWAGLSLVTLAIYKKQGIQPQGILQRSPGGLRDSVQGKHDRNSVTVGAGSGKSKDYAAIHQFGGMAGRNKTVKIPARPYLPMDSNGFLQPEAERAMDIVAMHFLSTLFD